MSIETISIGDACLERDKVLGIIRVELKKRGIKASVRSRKYSAELIISVDMKQQTEPAYSYVKEFCKTYRKPYLYINIYNWSC